MKSDKELIAIWETDYNEHKNKLSIEEKARLYDILKGVV